MKQSSQKLFLGLIALFYGAMPLQATTVKFEVKGDSFYRYSISVPKEKVESDDPYPNDMYSIMLSKQTFTDLEKKKEFCVLSEILENSPEVEALLTDAVVAHNPKLAAALKLKAANKPSPAICVNGVVQSNSI